MANATQRAQMRQRKAAAKSALKFFKKIKTVRSANWALDRLQMTDQQENNFYDSRGDWETCVDSMEGALEGGIGNCDEKGKICFLSLKSNPRLHGHHVSLSAGLNYDHVFVIVADLPVPPGPFRIGQMGLTAMIVDGWTEDWYFPNLSVFDSKRYGLGTFANPRQLYVRMQIARHRLEHYDEPLI